MIHYFAPREVSVFGAVFTSAAQLTRLLDFKISLSTPIDEGSGLGLLGFYRMADGSAVRCMLGATIEANLVHGLRKSMWL